MLFNDVGVASVAVLSQLKAIIIITIIVCKHIQFNLFSIVFQKKNIYYLNRRLILYYLYIIVNHAKQKCNK